MYITARCIVCWHWRRCRSVSEIMVLGLWLHWHSYCIKCVVYLPWVRSVNLSRQRTGHLCDRCCTTIRRHGIGCDATRMCAIWCILDINYETSAGVMDTNLDMSIIRAHTCAMMQTQSRSTYSMTIRGIQHESSLSDMTKPRQHDISSSNMFACA